MRPRRMKIASDGTAYEESAAAAPTESRLGIERLSRHPLVIAAVLLVAAYAILAVVLNVVVDTNQVRGWVAPRASAALNRPVSIGGARVALLPRPSIHLRDVRVDNLENFDGPALAFVERIRLDVRWLPLIVGRADIHAIRMDAPRVYLAIDEGGTSNFGDLAPSPESSDLVLPAPVALSIDRVEVAGASLSFFNAPAARSFTISGADVHATVGRDGAAGWRADIEAESDTLLARLASVTEEILQWEGPRATLTARGDGTGRSIDLEHGTLELSGASLAVSGRVTGLKNGHPAYDLQLTNDALDASVVATTLPPDTRSTLIPAMEGSLGVTFQVTSARSPGQPAVLRGSLLLADVTVRVSGQAMVDHVNGTIGVSPETVVLDSLTGSFADGPFELSGSMARSTRTVALRTRARPDLDALDRLGLVPAGVTLSGDADIDLSVVGDLDALDSIDVAGSVTLAGLQAKHPHSGVPLYVPAGVLSLSGSQLSWTDLPVLLGQEELVTSGTASGLVVLGSDAVPVPQLDVSVRGSRMDLGAILPLDEGVPDIAYARLAFEHLGGRRVAGQPAEAVMADLGMSRPRSLPVRGSVRVDVDTLDFRDYHLESVSARLDFADSTLVVEAPGFTIWGGDASGSLLLGIGDLREEPFAFTLTADSTSAAALLGAWTPASEAVSGTLRLRLEVAGSMDSSLLPVGRDLAGHVTLSVTDGRVRDTGPNLVVADFLGSPEWTDVPFTRWDTEADIEARRLEIRGSELEGELGRVALEGLLHLDGSHDLSMGLSIAPDHLANVSLRRTGIGQSVLDQLAEAGNSLDLGLRMSGVLNAPQLEPDASNALGTDR